MNLKLTHGDILGLIGTLTGTISLIISYFNWRFSHPKIEITGLTLRMQKYEDKFLREYSATDGSHRRSLSTIDPSSNHQILYLPILSEFLNLLLFSISPLRSTPKIHSL